MGTLIDSVLTAHADGHMLSVAEYIWKLRERVIVNDTGIGIVLKSNIGKLLRDWMERILAFPSA